MEFKQIPQRKIPNILITGTPGTGKTSLAQQLSQSTGYVHHDISLLAKEKNLCDGWDDEYKCYIIDEDKICDELENQMNLGGNIVDYHGCDFFPERWFDLVVVLRTNNTVLYDRLSKRNYHQKKLTDNIESEIFGVILEEAEDSYKKEIILELENNEINDLERNLDLILEWIKKWESNQK
ncbi:pos9-activating factor fap7-related [Anaeramoeba ignava]|uniref:Adenylate kinase isoenzyme 6 homolog n=1 Tax=Anaeramoeba ignava TaxID=1746090 RepID=A0A9Q0RAA9_ANAIG|nr:pos9-activating factor fap7-related [Anaeramoeba ignava]